jgi:hypothetical protein
MGEFFKGWRRKVAVMTLVLACVFTAGWVRSLAISDHFDYRTDATHIHFVSSDCGRLSYMRSHEMTLSHVHYANFHFTGAPRAEPPWSHSNGDIKWHWQWYVIELGSVWFKQSGQLMGFWSVPYWPIVILLTLVSAWLLLSNPRHLKFAAVQPLQQLS